VSSTSQRFFVRCQVLISCFILHLDFSVLPDRSWSWLAAVESLPSLSFFRPVDLARPGVWNSFFYSTSLFRGKLRGPVSVHDSYFTPAPGTARSFLPTELLQLAPPGRFPLSFVFAVQKSKLFVLRLRA
jgi:hypothetical protein